MPSKMLLNIDLRRLAKDGGAVTVSLDNTFFEGLDQDEIIGGTLEAVLGVREQVENVFEVTLDVKGQVIVACDRCLEKLDLPVEAHDVLKVYATAEEHLADEVNARFLTGHGFDYDFSWDIYELVEVSLPIQRVHEEGMCNPDMLEYLNKMI